MEGKIKSDIRAFLDLPNEVIIPYLFQQCFESKLPIAMWRLPLHLEQHLIIDLSDYSNRVKADLEELGSGFIFSPFINPDLNHSLFIQSDFHFRLETKQIDFDPLITNEKIKKIKLDAKEASQTQSTTSQYFFKQKHTSEDVTPESYQDIIKLAIDAIKNEQFHKVVPSNIRRIEFEKPFDVVLNFKLLCESYPNAFVSVVSIPGEGTWLGSTPEPLISMDINKMFRTASLAGTQRLSEQIPLSEVGWKQKEIEEQAMVSRYIINCFKKIRLREFEEIGPRTVKAANLVHLKTDYLVNTQEVNFPQLGTVMLKLLHPTAAVCGLPMQPALNFIQKHEIFDREFYSGFLGPVNMDEETYIFVNLRCMQIFSQFALLYAGAGVTADSDPENEWLETKLKCDTLLDIIKY